MNFRTLLRDLRLLLTRKQKHRFIKYQLFFILAGLLQLAGAGSIAPFVGVLSQPKLLETNRYLVSFQQLLGITEDLQALIAIAVAMIALLILSNVANAIAVWLTFRFSLDIGSEVKDDLLTCYLRREYVQLAGTNSSELINRVVIGAPRFAFNIMQPIMVISSQGALLLVILIGLAFYEPKVLIVFGSLIGGGYFALFFIVRKRLVAHGENIWNGGRRLYKLLTECLGGLKEIRLAGTEDSYRAEHHDRTRDIYQSEALVGMLTDVPRFLLETISISALLVLAIAMLLGGEPPSSVIASLTLYAMAGYRMLPAGQAIFKSVSQIRANLHFVPELLPDILEGRRLHSRDIAPMQHRDVPEYPADLILEHVSFRYPNSSDRVLHDVTARIPANSLTVLVGSSGSGKSTLSDILLGLLQPELGSVKVGSVPIQELGPKWYKSVGYVPQDIFLLDDSLEENIAFGSPLGIEPSRLKLSVTRARLSDLVETLDEGLKYRVGEGGARLSGGQRQRVGIARALYHDARFLILDEATSALDSKTEAGILETLLDLRKDRTIVMIAHRLTTIRAADYVIMLKDGVVCAEGPYKNVLTESTEFRSMMLSADADVENRDNHVSD